MLLRPLALTAALACTACASIQPHPLPSEKNFSVPKDLANKFAVTEGPAPVVSPAVAVPPHPPLLAAMNKEAPVRHKGKKTRKKAQGKNEAPAVTAVAPAKTAFANRWSMKPFFQPGEFYLFDITYFGATAGQLEMTLLPPKELAGRQAYHVQGRAWTSSVFSLFYRLNDIAETFFDTEGLFTHKFSLKLDESLQERDLLELYDQSAHKLYYWSKLEHKKKGERLDQFNVPIEPYTQDSLSAFFYVRTLPLEIGQVYRFPLATNGKTQFVQITVVRKETINTRIGELPAIVIQPEAILDGVLKKEGDSFIWISDDDRRIILKIDAKIKVGSVIAYLREHNYEGASQQKRH